VDGISEHQRCEACKLVTEPYCGDGVKGQGEECDGIDGVGDHQSCNVDCKIATEPYCGDGIVSGIEECDDSNALNGDGCSSECKIETPVPPAQCGNGAVEGSEVCDSDSRGCRVGGYAGTQSCNSACDGWNACQVSEFCGDAVVNGAEVCDDGNGVDGDGCSSICTVEPPGGGEELLPVCGNLITESGEVCDGNSESCIINSYTGMRACAIGCESFGVCETQQFCGDSVVNGLEQCDDGNTLNGDGCSSTCAIEQGGKSPEPACGNAILESDEECDDGNRISGDGCSSLCRLPHGSPYPPQPQPGFGQGAVAGVSIEILSLDEIETVIAQIRIQVDLLAGQLNLPVVSAAMETVSGTSTAATAGSAPETNESVLEQGSSGSTPPPSELNKETAAPTAPVTTPSESATNQGKKGFFQSIIDTIKDLFKF